MNNAVPMEIANNNLSLKEAGDWQIADSSIAIQNQLDEMANWYLLKHPDFVEFAKSKDAAIKLKTNPEAREELLTYPGLKAIAAHEIAHHYYNKNTHAGKIIARKLAEAAHSQTGLDIHPGTKIGDNCFIDHSTGDVVGETAKIGNNTVIYHGVTLGAVGTAKDTNHRHPEIGDNCLISVGTNILGNVKIGNKVIIGSTVDIRGNNLKIGNGVEIKSGAHISDGNQIADGIKIGERAVIPWNTGLININVPDDCMVVKEGDKLKAVSLAGNENILQGIMKEVKSMAERCVGKLGFAGL